MADHFPLPGYHFRVTIDGTKYSFQEVSGLEQEYDFVEHRYGNDLDLTKAKRLSMVKTSTISMKRGVINTEDTLLGMNTEAYENKTYNDDWGENVDLIIELLDEEGKCVVNWTIDRAYPTKYSFGSLNSQSNEVIVETMEFVHDGMKMTQNSV